MGNIAGRECARLKQFPSPQGREGLAAGAVISRSEWGAPRSAGRGGEGVLFAGGAYLEVHVRVDRCSNPTLLTARNMFAGVVLSFGMSQSKSAMIFVIDVESTIRF